MLKKSSTLIKAVLFDLDGTLLDTVPDLAFALNYLLQAQGHPPLLLNEIRPVASHGAKGLLKLGFDITDSHPNYENLRQQLLTVYHSHLSISTVLFPGMAHVLDFLEQYSIPWGIVTNKPSWLTEPLLVDLKLAHRASCVISGDTLTVAKPAPEPLLHAARLLDVDPQNCIYVGDAERDMIAARSAGMIAILASYGYLAPEDKPQTWGADGEIANAEQLLDWLNLPVGLSVT